MMSFMLGFYLATTAIDGERVLPAADPRVGVVGRTSLGPQGRMLAYPGVTLQFRWRGPGLALQFERLGENGWFELMVDQLPPRTIILPEGVSRVTLAQDLPADAVHVAQLVRRIESWQGTVRLREVVVPDGTELLDPPAARGHRLLFIGDSVTCGASVHPDAPESPNGVGRNDASVAYGMILGKRLLADVHLVSYGGRGLVRDWQGLTNDQTNNAPIFFERACPDDAAAPWDHASWTPEVIVIGLGTNDFNQGVPQRTEWLSAYAAFLVRIRAVHPQSQILLLTSPILGGMPGTSSGEKRTVLTEYISSVVTTARARGDRRISFHDLAHQPGSPHDGHPTAAQHQAMANELLPIVTALLQGKSGR